MKKIYSLALAALVAASASAALPQLGTYSNTKAGTNKITSGIKMEKIADFDKSAKAIKTNADVSASSIEGDYAITLGDYYREDYIGRYETTASITQDGDLITISCADLYEDVTATYNETTGEISFTYGEFFEFPLDETTTGYLRFEPFVYDYSQQAMVATEYSATYNKGVINFPSDLGDTGFRWAVYSSPERPSEITYKGSVFAMDVYSMYNTSMAVIYENASWTENIFAEAFGGVANEPYNVTVRRIGDLYTINNAFEASHIQFTGESNQEIPMTIDAFDPNNCKVDQTSAGLQTDSGSLIVFSFSMGYVTGDVTPNPITCVEDDTTITISFPQYSMIAAMGQSAAYGCHTPSVLVINKGDAGVDGVEIDNSNAPVEYFNLQGVKVAEPSNGLYIVRQGNKVTKQVIR